MKDILWLKADATDEAGQGAPKLGNDDNNVVSSINNVIYFYSEVNRPKNLDLNSSSALKHTIASNMIESLIGALFLDSNYSICEKIVSEIFRGISHSMDKTMEIACGLWNFHIKKKAGFAAG